MEHRIPITRRSAIGTGTLSALGVGLMAAVGGAAVVAGPLAVPAIDRAEALMHELEGILLGLDQYARIDVLVELERLEDIAKALDPHAVAAELPCNTGANRSSIVMPWDES